MISIVATAPLLFCIGCADDADTADSASSDTEDATGSTSSDASVDGTETSPPGTTTSPDSGSTTDVADDTSSTTAADTDPPEVVSIDPAHGSVNVIDQPVIIEFSEPMDTASLEAAFPTATAFEWSNDDATVEMDLPFPFESTTTPYDIVIPTSVQDVAGNGLESTFTATVTLAALVSVTLDHDPALTGHQFEGGGSGTWFTAGDSTGDVMRFGGVSFPLDDLPAFGTVLGLYEAELGTQVIWIGGNPNAAEMGGFLIDHVQFGGISEIATATVLDEEFEQALEAGDVVVGANVSNDVTAQLETSWSTGSSHLQLRIRPGAVVADGIADRIFLRRGAEENPDLVSPGITEPDPDNRARIEVKYFAP